MDALINKYRPKMFKDLIGQTEVAKSITAALKRRTAQTFLFEGPPGVGKTTMARIVARKLGCAKKDIIEINAAVNTGIDAMREITKTMAYNTIGDSDNRAYILDEAHKLSSAAWASLLKDTEEPPEHCFWFICTTESMKVPKNIRTRCLQYQLAPVDAEEIFQLLKRIIAAEKFTTNDDVAYFLAEKSEGSPRQAIAFLAQCGDCTSTKTAAKLIRSVLAEGEVIELCRALAKGVDWVRAMKIVKKLNGVVSPESIRYTVIDYFGKVAMGAKSDRAAQRTVAVLDAFREPYPPNVSGMYPVIISLGNLLL